MRLRMESAISSPSIRRYHSLGSSWEAMSVAQRFSRASMISNRSTAFCVDTGVCIGIDMIGNAAGKGDEYRADLVSIIKHMGCLSQVTLSLDLCNREDLKSAGGYGYVHLFEVFLPMLKEHGITDDDIELMLDKTPRRVFMD